jgi:hypothetical protein
VNALLKVLCPIADLALLPAIYPAALLMRLVRRAGVERLPLCRASLTRIGVFPIMNQYYEPLFDFRRLLHPLDAERNLPGVDLNIPAQLDLLSRFRFSHELSDVADGNTDDFAFHFDNQFFAGGDAEFLYNLIRLRKPARIFEIGSGHSTLIAIRAVRRNQSEDARYGCRHVCVEPYETPWLEKAGVGVIRSRVEEVDALMFAELSRNDILCIDSSHIIRPQGDVLCEFLELLPALNPGVIVLIHDIFTPRDYPRAWVVDRVRFWNEQYLLEALLSGNPNWRILGAVNHLFHHHRAELQAVCPFLADDHEPSSFYIEKIGA